MKKIWLLLFFAAAVSVSVYAAHLRPTCWRHSVGAISPMLEITPANSSIANLSLEVVSRFIENINMAGADAEKPADEVQPTSSLPLSLSATQSCQFDVSVASFRLLLAVAFSAFLFLYLLKTLPKPSEKATKFTEALY